MDGIEALVYGLGALALLGFVVLVVIRASHRLAGPVGMAVAIAATVVAIGGVVRDVRAKRWSPFSVGAVSAYGACFLAVVTAEALTD